MSEGRQGLAWNPRFNIGKPEVDDQHRKLFQLIDELAGFCENGSSREKVKDALDFLVEYTMKHFYDEESIQVQYNFPDYRRHKQLHEDFKSSVGGIVADFNASGSSDELISGVNQIVAKWIVYHVLNEDRKIGEHIRSLENR